MAARNCSWDEDLIEWVSLSLDALVARFDFKKGLAAVKANPTEPDFDRLARYGRALRTLHKKLLEAEAEWPTQRLGQDVEDAIYKWGWTSKVASVLDDEDFCDILNVRSVGCKKALESSFRRVDGATQKLDEAQI